MKWILKWRKRLGVWNVSKIDWAERISFEGSNFVLHCDFALAFCQQAYGDGQRNYWDMNANINRKRILIKTATELLSYHFSSVWLKPLGFRSAIRNIWPFFQSVPQLRWYFINFEMTVYKWCVILNTGQGFPGTDSSLLMFIIYCIRGKFKISLEFK